MIRKLLLLFVVVGIWTVVVRMARLMAARPAAARPKPAPSPRFEGAMVRDRICETFLPRSRALSIRVADEEHFFCSAECRDRFLLAAKPAAR